MPEASELLLHATCIAIGSRGVLLRGPSGSGKSDLALRLLGSRLSSPLLFGSPAESEFIPERVCLVADDQVRVRVDDGRLLARSPATIAGKLEVRGIGIVDAPHIDEIFLSLVADLVPARGVERLPVPQQRTSILGIPLPYIRLEPFSASAPLKLVLALERLPSVPRKAYPWEDPLLGEQVAASVAKDLADDDRSRQT